MQRKLVIYLDQKQDACPGWTLVVKDAIRQVAHPGGDLAELKAAALNSKVVVLVPAEQVSLMMVKLPKMNRARLAQAIPFALEEQLIADLDTLHFAAGSIQPDGYTPVAVVDQTLMQLWLAQLEEWEIQVDILIPVTFALPYTEHTWTAVVSDTLFGDIATVRTGRFSGFACDHDNFMTLLDVALMSSEHVPQLIQIEDYSAKPQAEVAVLAVPLEYQTHNADTLRERLALNAGTTPHINLLQDKYAAKKSRYFELRTVLKAAKYLACVWIAILFIYPLVSYLILSNEERLLTKQMLVIYKKHFPDASELIAPQMRMEEQLKKLSHEPGQNQLLLLLGYLSKSLQNNANIELSRLDFQNQQLVLQLSAATSNDFTAFLDLLTNQGLSVKQQNAILTGQRVNATVSIEKGA